MKQPGVYILYSNKINKYYTGSTGNLQSRSEEHNDGRVTATYRGRPWTLKVFLPCSTIPEARKAEARLKKYKRRDVLEKVIESETFPWNYNNDD